MDGLLWLQYERDVGRSLAGMLQPTCHCASCVCQRKGTGGRVNEVKVYKFRAVAVPSP